MTLPTIFCTMLTPKMPDFIQKMRVFPHAWNGGTHPQPRSIFPSELCFSDPGMISWEITPHFSAMRKIELCIIYCICIYIHIYICYLCGYSLIQSFLQCLRTCHRIHRSCPRLQEVAHISQKLCTFHTPPNNVRVQLLWNGRLSLGALNQTIPICVCIYIYITY